MTFHHTILYRLHLPSQKIVVNFQISFPVINQIINIRLKITIWFTAALVVIVLFAYLMIFVVSRQILIKTIQDILVETVENNVDEIEYFSGMDEIRTDADIDYLIDYRKGYLEIDDDFLSKVNEVYTGLYDEKSRLIYGENPIAAKVADLEFVDSEIQKVMKDGTGYYIFDRKLTAEGLNGLWLRGVVSEEQGERQSFGIMRIALVLLPVLVVIASAGGFFIAGRTLNISASWCSSSFPFPILILHFKSFSSPIFLAVPAIF